MTRTLWITACLVVSLLTASLASAQPGPPPPGDPPSEEEWAEMMQKISLLRTFKLVEVLDLDEESAAQLAVYLKDKDDERVGVMTARRELHQDVRKWVEAGGTDDKVAGELIQRGIDLEEQQHSLNIDLISGLDGILSPAQQLKYVMADQEFEREVHGIIRDFRRDKRGGGPGQGRGPHGGGPPPRE